MAAGYDEFVTPSNIRLAEESLHLARLRPDMKFLDVAAGTGALSLPAARMGAQVMATDISPAMVERLTLRARQERLSYIEGRVMDGHQLDLEDKTFDISGSQFGVMLMPELPKALSEMTRVTLTGGRVMITTFGPPTQVEFLSIPPTRKPRKSTDITIFRITDGKIVDDCGEWDRLGLMGQLGVIPKLNMPGKKISGGF